MHATPHDLDLLADRTRFAGDVPEARGAAVRAIVDVLSTLEPDLILPDPETRAEWLAAKHEVRWRAEAGPAADGQLHLGTALQTLRVIAKRYWRGPSAGFIRPLPFVRDVDLRRIAERDWGALGAALRADQTKSCLVLAGSVIEAVMLDALEGNRERIAAALEAARAADGKRRRERGLPAQGRWRPATELDFWPMWQMVRVAGPDGLGILSGEAVTLASTVRDLRHVVHPASERRAYAGSDPAPAEAAAAHALAGMVIEQVERASLAVPTPSGDKGDS